MRTDTPLAYVLSDIHFSHKAPIARSQEPDWYEAMSRPWKELMLANCFHGAVPIIVAGDLFHHWNVPAELINFAIQTMPVVYALPGQHDLPHHRYEDIKRSAFWTLVEAGKVKLLDPEKPTIIGSSYGGPELRIHAFPWGKEVVPLKKGHDLAVDVAVVHAFIWSKDTGYEGAPPEARLGKWYHKLEGYDAAVFGDNHINFCVNNEDSTSILNCGCFIRRSISEAQRPAYYGKLTQKGIWECMLLDGSKDRFIDKEEIISMVEEALDVGGFIEELAMLGASGISFLEALQAFFRSNKVSKAVQRLIMEAVEKQ